MKRSAKALKHHPLTGAFQKIARTISGQHDIQVIPSGSRCSTDGKVIYIPFYADFLPQEDQAALNGLLDHETCHVIEEGVHRVAGSETPFQIINRIGPADKRLALLFNAVEDIRIEHKYGARYPGMASNLASARASAVDLFVKRHAAGKSNGQFWTELVAGFIIRGHAGDDSWISDSVRPYLDLLGDEVDAAIVARNGAESEEIARSALKKIQDAAAESHSKSKSEDAEEDKGDDAAEKSEGEDAEDESESGDSDQSEDAAEESEGEDADGEAGGSDGDGEAGEGETAGAGEADADEDADEDADQDETEDANEGESDAAGEKDSESDDGDEDADQDANQDETEDEEGSGGEADEAADEAEGAPGSESTSDPFEAGRDAMDEQPDTTDVTDALRDRLEEVSDHFDRKEARYKPSRDSLRRDRWTEATPGAWGDRYDRMKDDVSGQISALRGKQMAELQTIARSRLIGGLEDGDLDGSALARVRAGDRRVFAEVRPGRKIDTAIQVLLDLSGSVGRAHDPSNAAYWIARSTVALCESWNPLPGVAFDVMGFHNYYDSSYMPFGTSRVVDATMEYSRPGFEYVHFKRWDERLAAVRTRFQGIHGRQDNADHEAVWTAALRLAARPEARKILVVISDGMPACSSFSGAFLERQLRRVVKDVTSAGFEVWGVGAGTDAPRKFYNAETGANNCIVNNLSTMAPTLISLFRNRLREAV